MKWGIFWQVRGRWVPRTDYLFHTKRAAWDFVDQDRNRANAGRPDGRRPAIAQARRNGLRLCPAEIVPSMPAVYLAEQNGTQTERA